MFIAVLNTGQKSIFGDAEKYGAYILVQFYHKKMH